jgi:DNA-binding SARP family transcriptional activator
MLQIDTLGGLIITRDGDAVTQLATRKVVALLVYLACTGRAQGREVLAEFLWPEGTPERAQGNLRVALTSLRKHLGDYVLIRRDNVALNPDAQIRLDARDLEADLQAGQVEAALALYRGEFLQGFYLRGAPAFDDWATQERERLHLAVVDALLGQVDRDLAGGAFRAGIEHAHRLLALDPLLEAAHRQMMLLLAASGQRGAALAQYETCRGVLGEELGVEPSPEVQETYELLLKGERPAGIPVAPAAWEREAGPVAECPYRGLAAFREEDAAFFFGREGFARRLVQAVQERPLVAVIVGSSGSGKSSAVFAGLLPRLRAGGDGGDGDDGGDWLIAGFRPGTRPFRALAGGLVAATSPELDGGARQVQARELADGLLSGELRLADAVADALQNRPGAQRLLLVADQFEELYTLCPEREHRRRFLDELLAAVEAAGVLPEPRFVLLLTMRADFMGQALAHRPFADALQEACLMLGPLNREELASAVEKPARVQGVAFEAGLVERILDDVGQEPGNLPLLEFALTLLWERQSYGWLSHAGYEEIGRVEGALARYADEVFAGLEVEARAKARQVFVQLVRPGEGTEDTRRLATRAEVGEEN